MKTLLLIISLSFVTPLLSSERDLAEQVLAQRNLSISKIEQDGSALLLGEVTGAGLTVKDLEMILTRDQVIFKHEIESTEFKTTGRELRALDSFRAFGVYFLKEDVIGIVVKLRK